MNTAVKYGIVQGRLLAPPNDELQWFPRDHWENEFSLASQIGLDFIEFISTEKSDENNPLWSNEGHEKILKISEKTGINLNSACFDYIIGNNILSEDQATIKSLLAFIEQCKELNLKTVVLPFFGKSEINNYNILKFEPVFNKIFENIPLSMNICIETLMDSEGLNTTFDSFNYENLYCVFDTGNTVALGHDLYKDILSLGSKIKHVHIKDKDINNDNVLLGTGLVDFYSIFKALNHIDYQGSYVFETHRGRVPLETAKYNINFINFIRSQII